MSMIWKQPQAGLEALNRMNENTMGSWLGIRFTEIGPDFLKAAMTVGPQVHQPYGLLHGGASAALAETVGSVASWLCIDPVVSLAVGLEINCNHIRGKRDGEVRATARPLHIGKTTHVWDIRITDEREKLVCISRLTVSIIKNAR